MLNNAIKRATRSCLLLPSLLLASGALLAQARQPQNLSPGSHIKYVFIPSDLSGDDVVRAGRGLKQRLHEFIKKELQSNQPVQQDLLVVLVDRAGLPILPEVQEAKKKDRKQKTNDLKFTFDSQTYPWGAGELTALNSALNALYPSIKAIYGDPAFNISVNIRKDPDLSSAGMYNVSTNDIVLKDASSMDVLCHETIHAFRDDDIISLGTFEEGMARAAEVEVVSRLEGYNYWDQNHSYTYDVYYEALNKPDIGSFGGDIFSNFTSTLARYQLAGYAWGKVLLEHPRFFIEFNEALYTGAISNDTITSTESLLLGIADKKVSKIEGKPFLTWYRQQGVLNTAPPTGYILYQRVNQFVVDFFLRDDSGTETLQQNATVHWKIYDFQGELLSSGDSVTSEYGWLDILPPPSDYTGRIKIVACASTPNGEKIRDTALRSLGNEAGVFGIVTDAEFGTITITPLGDGGPPVTVGVARGAFSAPSLSSLRGRFRAVFNGVDGRRFSRLFTKDASDYFLSMDPEAEILSW